MYRVVLDTNVIISGLAWKGKPNQIIGLWRKDELQFYISAEILNEYLDLVRRRLGPEYHQWFIRLIEAGKHVKIVKPSKNFHIIVDDPSDNKFIDCAVESGAEYIITGDKHLLNLGKFENIEILSPDAFIKKISEKE